MKRRRFSEEQIIAILREQEAGAKTADVCRRYGISDATFYKWKAKYGGLEVSEAKRLKALEDENAKLKKLLAEAMLDNAMLKDIAAKSGDAWRQAGSRGSPLLSSQGQPGPGVFCVRGRSQLDPVLQSKTAGRCGPYTASRACGPAAAFRTPPAALADAAGGIFSHATLHATTLLG